MMLGLALGSMPYPAHGYHAILQGLAQGFRGRAGNSATRPETYAIMGEETSRGGIDRRQ